MFHTTEVPCQKCNWTKQGVYGDGGCGKAHRHIKDTTAHTNYTQMYAHTNKCLGGKTVYVCHLSNKTPKIMTCLIETHNFNGLLTVSMLTLSSPQEGQGNKPHSLRCEIAQKRFKGILFLCERIVTPLCVYKCPWREWKGGMMFQTRVTNFKVELFDGGCLLPGFAWSPGVEMYQQGCGMKILALWLTLVLKPDRMFSFLTNNNKKQQHVWTG